MLCKKLKKLKLFQWNAQGATTKSVQLQIDHRVNKEKVDVVFIVETFLSSRHAFKLTNFIVYRCDRSTHGGGVLIAVRKDIEHKRLANYNTTIAENISIEIRLDNHAMVLTTAYVPKYTANFAKDIVMMTPNNKNVIVLGDFNAKHTAWNCTANNRAGMLNMLQTANFVLYHPDSHTHFPHSGATPSTIDYALTNTTVSFSNVYTLDSVLPSDHDPVICIVEGFDIAKKIASKRNYKKANWKKFSEIIEEKLDPSNIKLSTKADIDEELAKFINAIRIAENESVPLETKRSQRTTISKETAKLIQLRNTTKRSKKRCYDPDVRDLYSSLINQQNKCIKRHVDKDFNNTWSNAIRSLKPGDPKIWSVAKKMTNKSPNRIDLLKVNNECITSDEEIAETLADQFEKNHLLTINEIHSHDQKIDKVVETIDRISPALLDNSLHHINTNVLRKIIKKLKIKKAPGIDGVPNILIKRLPEIAIEFLKRIFNGCIDLCYFPKHLKTAKITPILKSSKDSKIASNYRPISLLSSIGKILEKILRDKLCDSLSDNGIIMQEQFGFREGHSTVHQIKRIVNIIKQNKECRRSTGIILLDIEKAFDSVWHNGLLYKLKTFGTPIYLIKMIASFLRDRSFVVDVNGKLSSPKPIPAGLAQGSILSPILWTAFTSDLKKAPNCDLGLYADDTAILATAKHSNKVIRTLSLALARIHAYFTKWKIKINCDKTQAILFKFNRARRRNPTIPLLFNGSTINLVRVVKYLGVTIDDNLNFNSHIEEGRTKALKSFNALYPLLCRKSRLSTPLKLTLFKSVIRPKITYASPVWDSISKTALNKLQLVQNKILKSIMGYPRTFSTHRLHASTNIDMVQDTLRKYGRDFSLKCSTSNFEIIRQLA